MRPVSSYPDIPSARRILLRRARVPLCLTTPEAFTRMPDGRDEDGTTLLDIRVEDGTLTAIGPSGQTHASVDEGGIAQVDLAGRQVWPMFLDCHAHLDKTQIIPRAGNADGSFAGAREGSMADRQRHWTQADIERRMEFALRCAVHHGSSAIRTHLDSHEGQAEATWEVFQTVRGKWRERITLQAVALAVAEVYDTPFGDRLLDLVAAAGGIVGTFLRLPDHDTEMPAGIDPFLDRLFDKAARRGLDVDLHVDETANPASRMLEHVARAVLRTGFPGRVVCGHCCSLAMQAPSQVQRTLELCATAGVGIVTLPTANLYLQDRRPGITPRWRGVTLVREMQAAGLTVAVGGDNVRDPFFPYGDNDMLDTLRQAVRILHLDHPIADMPSLAGRNAAQLMGLEQGVLRPGAAARLVIFNARSLNEMLSRPQSDRIVLDRGHLVTEPLPAYEELDDILQAPSPGNMS
ncbi:cytosine deaminase [Castellaniella sp. GW247-6E4]|uniref:cytosine deaminase n=1 Tax=Castellaniella sp. GW247-6E4 TaxID=3140380 RepID=UPI003315032E